MGKKTDFRWGDRLISAEEMAELRWAKGLISAEEMAEFRWEEKEGSGLAG